MYDDYLPKEYILDAGTNHYRIEETFSTDDYGFDYKAICIETNKQVTIREFYLRNLMGRNEDYSVIPSYHRVVMASREDQIQKGLENFSDRAKKLLSLSDTTRIEKALDLFYANNTAYLVTEPITGKPLHKLVREGSLPPKEQLLPEFEALMVDIEKATEAGLIHGDIEPTKIYLTDAGTLFLRYSNAEDRTITAHTDLYGYLEHTYPFSPIEIFSNKPSPFPNAFDVYSLAASMYYCLTSKVPTEALMRLDSKEDPLILPNDLGAGLTDCQQAALLKAMDVQPKNRYQSMQEFLDALQGKNRIKNMIKRRVWKK